MNSIIKNSLVYKWLHAFALWIAGKWNSSIIGGLFIKDRHDVKTKNSLAYRILNTPVNFLNKLKMPECFRKWGQGSCLIGLISHFEWFVYLAIFAAPFVPTFACLALVGIAFISYVIYRLFVADEKISIDSFSFLLILLLVIFGVCAVTSLAPAASVKIYMVYLPFIAFVFLTIRALDTKDKVKTAVTVFVTAGLLVSLYGIYQQFFGDNLGHAWLDDEMFEDITVRVYSTLENPNVLGEYLLLVLPLSAAMIWSCKKLISKLYFSGVFCAAALCMIFTQSRGCWLGLILSAAVFAVLVDKRLVFAGIIVLLCLPFVLPQSIIARFTSIGNLSDSSSSYRLYIWLGTIAMLKDFWLYGIGLGSTAYNQVYPFYSYSGIIAPHAHNLYLQIMCETGISGLVVFCLFIIVTLKKMFTGYLADKKGMYGIICAAVIAGLFGFLLQGMFDYVWYNYRVFLMFWIFIGMGIASGRCASDKDNSCNQ